MIGRLERMNVNGMDYYHSRYDNKPIEETTPVGVAENKPERSLLITDSDKRTLVDMICQRQTEMIQKEHMNFESYEYQNLELLKIKVKALET